MIRLKRLIALAAIAAVTLMTVPAQAQGQKDIFMSDPISVDSGFTSIGVNWNRDILSEDRYTLHLRFRQDDQWTQWYYVAASSDYNVEDEHQSSAFFSTNYSTQYQYMLSDLSGNEVLGKLIDNIEFVPISQKAVNNFSLDELVSAVKTDITDYTSLNLSSQIKIISRTSWGADESLRVYHPDPNAEESASEPAVSADYQNFLNTYADELKVVRKVDANENGEPLRWPLEYPEKISKIFIHHTATTKNLDNPRQAIRDIYYWHAISRGWGDIGYNFIIDPQGNIYEGRYGGDGVIGAHTARANNGSIGIALLGNFEETDVPTPQLNSLVNLIRNKSEQYNIDPTGNTRFRGKMMPNINGHRDFSATACPGKNLYAQIPSIRSLAAADVVSVSSNAEDYDYRIISKPANPIPALQKGKFEFEVTLRNMGSETWLGGGINRVAIVDEKNRTIGNLVESQVRPGATGTFRVKGFTPEKLGVADFKIRPIIGEKTTFDNAWITIQLNVFAEPYKAQLVSIASERVFHPGEVKNIWIKFRNNGSTTWDHYGSDGFQFTYLAPTEVKILRGKVFEDQVPFGEEGTILVTISAPKNVGDYQLYFQPWFNGNGLTDYRIEFPITVSTDPNAVSPPAPQVEKILQTLNLVPTTPKSNQTTDNQPPSDSTDTTTSTSQETNANIRVALSFRGDPIITGDGPFEVFNGDQKLAAYKSGDQVKVLKNSADYQIIQGDRQFYSNQPPRFVPGLQTILSIENFENHPAWNPSLNDNSYRGTLEVRTDGSQLMVINELPLETYLRGIGEVSNNAHPEKIKALIVSARTYAEYYLTEDRKFPNKPYDLDDSPDSSQKYLGFGLEKRSPNIVEAIRSTAGEVVIYNGKLVKTPYFNQSDGRTRSAKEVWGWNDTPYLQSVEDKYCTATELQGHGVGMSGCGATGMAEAGFNYQEILKYFYQGVEIVKK